MKPQGLQFPTIASEYENKYDEPLPLQELSHGREKIKLPELIAMCNDALAVTSVQNGPSRVAARVETTTSQPHQTLQKTVSDSDLDDIKAALCRLQVWI
jgi:hypothetical protein